MGWEHIYRQAIDYIATWPGYYEQLQAPDMQEFAAAIVNAMTVEEAQAVLDKHLEAIAPKPASTIYELHEGAGHGRIIWGTP